MLTYYGIAGNYFYLNLNLSTKLQLISIVFDQSQVCFWTDVDFLSWHKEKLKSTDIKIM